MRIVVILLGLLTVTFGALAQQPDAQKIASIERQYLEQELAQAFQAKARIVALSIITREKLCELIAEDKRPDECKK